MSMDSWASGIARPILYADNYNAPKLTGAGQAVTALFFISYTFIAGMCICMYGVLRVRVCVLAN